MADKWSVLFCWHVFAGCLYWPFWDTAGFCFHINELKWVYIHWNNNKSTLGKKELWNHSVVFFLPPNGLSQQLESRKLIMSASWKPAIPYALFACVLDCAHVLFMHLSVFVLRFRFDVCYATSKHTNDPRWSECLNIHTSARSSSERRLNWPHNFLNTAYVKHSIRFNRSQQGWMQLTWLYGLMGGVWWPIGGNV